MNRARREIWQDRLLVPLLLFGLPAFGIWLRGDPLAPYLQLPPQPLPRPVEDFSWIGFGVIAAVIAAGVLPFALRVLHSPKPAPVPPRASLPWWGWGGVLWLALAWLISWGLLPGFAGWREHGFSALWLGYIVVVNGLVVRRGGNSPLLQRPIPFLALFPLSALFWWYFEYANRFVHNWSYLGTEHYTALQYSAHASLAFSTVLPAVFTTRQWLATYPRLYRGLDRGLPLRPRRPRRWALLALAGSGFTLAASGVWPQFLFPLLWVAPLALIVSLDALRGRHHVFSPPARGDWRGVWIAALAALVCGLCWELWNFYSYPKWVYTVPWVGRFHLFEMPLLGYAGYLPFGLECMAVAGLYLPKLGHQLKAPEP